MRAVTGHSSQSEDPGLVATPGNLLERRLWGPHCRPAEPEMPGGQMGGPSVSSQAARGFPGAWEPL